MIRLNKLTDYAVVLLSEMAHRPEPVSSAAALSAATRVPEATVGRVLKMLARGGVLRSVRGAGGGYGLSRAPEQIAVVDIITAIEGPVSLVECLDPGTGHCSVEAFCTLRGRWDMVNEAIERTLADVTLADMLPDTPYPPRADAPDPQSAGRATVEA